LKYTDGNGNTSTQNQNITINSQPYQLLPQTFCIQETATINDINWPKHKMVPLCKWNTLLQLYYKRSYLYASNHKRLRKEMIPVMINIQNTAAQQGVKSNILLSQNPTLNTIVISGTALQWYDSTGSFYLIQLLCKMV
jgi:hypothetical protein